MKNKRTRDVAQPSKRTAGQAQLPRRVAGFSLIELMIAMVLGLLVLSGVFQVFISSKQSNKTLLADAEMQENARFAFSVMTEIIQQAGNFGCQTVIPVPSQSVVKSANPATETFKPWKIIEGWEAKDSDYGETYTTDPNSGVSQISTGNWTSSAGAKKDSGIKSKKYSDILKVWYTNPGTANVTAQASGVLTLSSIDLKKGDILAINDCQTVSFAQVCACEEADCAGDDTKADINETSCSAPGNNALNLSNLNLATAQVSVLNEAIFFVGKRSDSTTGYKENIPLLYMKNLGNNAKPGNKIEILDGVESLQILYGEDTNNDRSPDYYVSADKVVDWNHVVSLKLSLLLRSRNNNITDGAQSLKFNGADIALADGDRYLRRVFTTTIALRNRSVGF